MHRFAAECGVEFFVLGLRERRCHAVACVQARERSCHVNARIITVHEAFPADVFEVREFEVRPRLDVFGDVLGVILRLVFDELFAVRVHHADLAVVEVDLVVFVHHAHVIGVMGIHVAEDEVNVFLVGEHNIIEDLQAELGELDCPMPHLFDLFALFFGDALGQPAGDGRTWMHLPAADHLDHVVTILAHLDDLAADFQPNLVDHAEDIAFRNRRIGTHYKVRSAECVEVCGVVGAVERHVEKFAQHFCGEWRVDVIDRIRSLCRRHVVRLGAYAADAVGQQRHLFDGTPDNEPFESAQFGDLEIRVGDVAVIVQKDLDLAVTFKAGDGVYGYTLSHENSFGRMRDEF